MTDWPSEQKSQSFLSPGLVADEEIIIRLGFAPEHYLNGEVVVAAISSADLNEPQRGGYSVDRQKYEVEDVIRQRAETQMAKSPEKRQDPFIAPMETAKLRQEHTEDTRRAFIILDNSIEGNIAHASIMSAVKRTKSEIKELKDILVKYLQHRTPMESYF